MSDKVKLRYYDMTNPNEKIDYFAYMTCQLSRKKVKNALKKNGHFYLIRHVRYP